MGKQLLFATSSAGKLAEMKAYLTGTGIDIVGLHEFPTAPDVEETGTSFRDNAILKASSYAVRLGITALADDSGLEVEALQGRPGVYSARYGGEDLSFRERMALLIEELDRTGDIKRRANFACALAVADARGDILCESTGVCHGKISLEPTGGGGFGYDPLFIPDGYDHTFGELSETIKLRISHRARAFEQIIPFLRGFFAISA